MPTQTTTTTSYNGHVVSVSVDKNSVMKGKKCKSIEVNTFLMKKL